MSKSRYATYNFGEYNTDPVEIEERSPSLIRMVCAESHHPGVGIIIILGLAVIFEIPYKIYKYYTRVN